MCPSEDLSNSSHESPQLRQELKSNFYDQYLGQQMSVGRHFYISTMTSVFHQNLSCPKRLKLFLLLKFCINNVSHYFFPFFLFCFNCTHSPQVSVIYMINLCRSPDHFSPPDSFLELHQPLLILVPLHQDASHFNPREAFPLGHGYPVVLLYLPQFLRLLSRPVKRQKWGQ